MNRARTMLASLSLFAGTVAVTGCADSPTRYNRPCCADAAASAPVCGLEAPAPRPAACAPAMPSCAPIPDCAPPPCAPAPVCGLPCERGVSEWHVRALAGVPFQFGTDKGEGCFYWGADVGTTRCNCVGFDLFYRTMKCSNNEVSPAGPITSPTANIAIPAEYDFTRGLNSGKDGGRWQWVGIKATYEHSIGASNLYWWVGAGPEYFWTNDYLDDDDGFGGFAELGIGWKFASWGALRLGVDVHGESTSVTRRAAADSGSSRFLWTVAPALGLEIDF